MADPAINVLLIEDSATQAQVMRRMLKAYPRATYEIEWLESTETALERISSGSFDLVLLDRNLPGEDGLAFLRRVKGHENLPPIIMLTAGGDERTATEAMQAGASDYYPKSAINAETLGRAIHKSLEGSQLRNKLAGAEETIVALAAAIEAKDPLTRLHIQRVTDHSRSVGEQLGLTPHQLEMLRFGATLHDVGKIAVSELILGKAGPLNDEEWAEMRKHPLIGESICTSLRIAGELNPIIRHHHERWDGRGYPDGLTADEIPILARIICAVDAFDAMSSDRPYRPALEPDEILRELSAGSGTQFDPGVAAALIELIRSGAISARGPDHAASQTPAATNR